MRIRGHALEFLHSFAGQTYSTAREIWQHLSYRYSTLKDRNYYTMQLRNLKQGSLTVVELTHEVYRLAKGAVDASPPGFYQNTDRHQATLQVAYDGLWTCLSDKIISIIGSVTYLFT